MPHGPDTLHILMAPEAFGLQTGKRDTRMHHRKKFHWIALCAVAVFCLASSVTRADVVTNWNIKAGEIVVEAKLGPAPANRVLAIVHTAVYEAVTAKGAARSWTTINDFMQEVALARIYDGVHYHTSTEVGTAMGKQIGELAVAKYLRALKAERAR